MCQRARGPAAWGLAAALLAGAGVAAAGEFPLSRLVGTGDVLWQQPAGLTVDYATAAYAAGDYVAFYAVAAGPTVVWGVWLWDGVGFTRVVDSTMPEGQAGILDNRLFGVDDTGLVAVNIEAYAMVGWQGGALFTIAEVGGIPPAAPPGSTFYGFSRPVVRAGEVYFLGGITNVPVGEAVRVYSWSAGAGLKEIQPAGLCCFGLIPALGAPEVFLGAREFGAPSTDRGAIYRLRGDDEPEELFRFDSPFPGGAPGSFWLSGGGDPGAVANGVAFYGIDSNYTIGGLFRLSEAGAEKVLATGDPDILTGSPVDVIWPVFSTQGDRIAFRTGRDFTPNVPLQVVLQQEDRSLHSALAVGDLLEGGPVQYVELTQGGLAEEQLAIEVQRDNEVAVWLVDLVGEPPPSSIEIPTLGRTAVVLLGLALAVAGVVVTRRLQGRV